MMIQIRIFVKDTQKNDVCMMYPFVGIEQKW